MAGLFLLFSLTPHAFDIVRLILVVAAVLLRLILMPIYLQAYLNIAHDRLEDQKKEAGRITNVDLQRKVINENVCKSFRNNQTVLIILSRSLRYSTIYAL